jgi:hypothetical protein
MDRAFTPAGHNFSSIDITAIVNISAWAQSSVGARQTWAASRVNVFEFIEDILNLGTTTITEVFAVRKDPGLKSLV